MQRFVIAVIGILLGSANVSAQSAAQAAFETAYDAWDAGRYPEALVSFDSLLNTPDGGDYLRNIALVTGEMFTTVTIAEDGTNPQWSPDGQSLAFETPSNAPAATHVVPITGGAGFELPGTSARFSPDGRLVAYLVLEKSAAWEADRRAAQQRNPVRSREDFPALRRALGRVDAAHTTVAVYDMARGTHTPLPTPGLGIFEVQFGAFDGELMYVVAGDPDDDEQNDIYTLTASGDVGRLTDFPANKAGLVLTADGRHGVMSVANAFVGIVDLETGELRTFAGRAPAVSRDGSAIVFLSEDQGENLVMVMAIAAQPAEVYRTKNQIDQPAVAPSGGTVVFQEMFREDWELMLVQADGEDAVRLTTEIQHDLFPRFLSDDVLLAVIGEGRHRRSYLYDAQSGMRLRLFHNNTIRTVAPEYEWEVSPNGSRIAIVSERDGNTISPERGVYIVYGEQQVTREDVLDRIRQNLAAEQDLRRRGREMFSLVADQVRSVVADVATTRIFRYADNLHSFGSKFITEPGNAMAIDYLVETLRSFGYEPELQSFEPRPGIPSANVIATLPGTTDPELVYVLSSHFDSSNRGPGADDNSSGTTALLEAARVLKDHPQSATIQFAFFTGEEAGLLGSREFVRRAVENDVKLVGALNNDMVGFANNNRLDNTIRYSNVGIRDIQHGAAIQFTDLITYDAKYYKSTDAHAYYEAYGDIVGGIGSYPILGNPHYHQSHDVLETINQQLVAEVSKTTVATLMLLASSPSRLTGVEAAREGEAVTVRWNAALESDVSEYVIAVLTEGDDGPADVRVTVAGTEASITDVPEGAVIGVKAVNGRGMAGWDWARVVVQ